MITIRTSIICSQAMSMPFSCIDRMTKLPLHILNVIDGMLSTSNISIFIF